MIEKNNRLTTSNDFSTEVNMIDTEEEIEPKVSRESWLDPIIDYLRNSKVSEDKSQERKLRIKAIRYIVLEGVLYKKSFSRPLLRCVTREESKEILQSIHSGVCSNHFGRRSLAHKALTVG